MERSDKLPSSRAESGPARVSSEIFEYNRTGQKLQLGEKDAERLIESLMTRSAPNRFPQPASPPREVAAESVSLAVDLGTRVSGGRMSDEDLEELALVLKMTRSATNARQCGQRLLEETRRARDAEQQLMNEGVPAARTARRFPAA